MRAIVYAGVGSPPVVRSVPPPPCPSGGAVVAVRATGVCRSDWHAWRGHDPVTLPHIPGHEFAGEVVEIGAGVRDFAVGDRVTSPFVNGCGECSYCRAGDAQVCPAQTQPGFTHPGSFAELVAVRAADTNLVRLPAGLGFPAAAALGCRFATAYRALTAQAGLVVGEWVAIFGCGGVGLSAVMIAKALGARVIAVDPSPAARERAVELGADHAVEVSATRSSSDAAAYSSTRTLHDPSVIEGLSPGGVHVTVDAAGSAATADAAVRSLRRRGRHVQVGLMLGADALAPLPWDLVVARELEIYGSHGMAAAGYPPMLAMVADGRLDPAALVGRTILLDEGPAALMAMDQPAAGAGITTILV
ncbi:alcohol dehydrogenase catalytic domain-containing protein [Actinoplanes sp. NPDC051470]|uniref:alcohol dehydrogenase catalytic domain-containing protein n=1 Tax=Actinoplanes sp. NPDC051470 TaxID=3157224 RepID=UPI003425457F